jgi:ATP-binding cassette subfamily F protein 3
MRHALEVALQAFEGALLLVSHDRHLLRNTVEELLLVHDGRIDAYPEDLEGYEKWILSSYKTDRPAQERNSEDSRKARRQQAAARREQLRPLKRELAGIEAELASAEAELAALRDTLADPELYAGERAEELAELLRREGVLKSSTERLEERWLELQGELENLDDA